MANKTEHLTNFGYTQSRWVWQPSAIGPVLAHTRHPWYHIDHNRFKTFDDLLFWLFHLEEKTWVTKEDLLVIVMRFQEKNSPKERS